MRLLRRKLANLGEYLHPAHLQGLVRGDSREQLRAVRRSRRAQPPTHQLKQEVVREYARRFNSRILIETGTYRGDMVFAMLTDFTSIHTIELSPQLTKDAQARFSGQAHVSVHEGDSATVLPRLLAGIHEPCLFWLDGHSSGGVTAKGGVNTPILAELETILRHSVANHVILIDDAREFHHGKHYPSLKRVQLAMSSRYKNFRVENDIVRITV